MTCSINPFAMGLCTVHCSFCEFCCTQMVPQVLSHHGVTYEALVTMWISPFLEFVGNFLLVFKILMLLILTWLL